jgi:mono/diheme cytochrome c family protein
MLKPLSILGTLLILTAVVAVDVVSNPDPKATESAVERGEYLVILGGCGDCHSPKTMTAQGPVEDPSRLLSGHPSDESITAVPATVGQDGWIASCNSHLTAWAGPWGVSFAANLTSDKKTGIGNWTDEQFIKAMRTGKHRGFGRPILPPMPWFNLARATDEDLSAMLAYLKSTPAVVNEVPAPIAPSN